MVTCICNTLTFFYTLSSVGRVLPSHNWKRFWDFYWSLSLLPLFEHAYLCLNFNLQKHCEYQSQNSHLKAAAQYNLCEVTKSLLIVSLR